MHCGTGSPLQEMVLKYVLILVCIQHVVAINFNERMDYVCFLRFACVITGGGGVRRVRRRNKDTSDWLRPGC